MKKRTYNILFHLSMFLIAMSIVILMIALFSEITEEKEIRYYDDVELLSDLC